ncbi:hypothetical protein NQ317_009859, partial [Molorchus minor]
MELPRIASQTSICPPSIPGIQLLTEYQKPRTPILSKRLLKATKQPAEPQFAVIPSARNYQVSAVSQLRLGATSASGWQKNEPKKGGAMRPPESEKKTAGRESPKANRAEPIEALCANTNLSPDEVDNRPYLLQKILSSCPVSMVLDISEIQTAWQDSDFITDCLCWHNVYRQRHSAPPLTMSPELCYLAQTWANWPTPTHLAHTNRFYRNDKDIGQNLFCRPSNGLVQDLSGQEVATYWYSAVRSYDYGREPDCLHVNVNA